MAFFHYKAVSPEGKVIEGTLEAADQQTVLARLEERGQLPIKVLLSGEEGGLLGRELKLPWRRRKVSQNDLLVFTQQFSRLAQAGLPLDRSLTILRELTESDYLREIVRDLLTEIKAGKSLSEALAMYPQVFPKVYTNMIKAGEIGGALDEILGRLNEYLERAEELRNYVVSSLIYPAILVFVALLSSIILIGFVIPRFAVIFENAGAPIPLPMKLMLGASAFLTGYWWLLLLSGVGAWSLFQRWLKTEQGHLKWDRKILTLPLVGTVLQRLEVSRFSRTLGTLMKSSVPLIQSLNIVKEVVSNRAIAAALDPIKSGVKKGEGFVKPFRRSGVFPPFAAHLLEVGEETGRLDVMLLQVADTYDRELRTAVKRLIAFFEPTIILVMGIVFGIMIVSILYSILSINDVPM
ncbi:MAG: type II secretion system F family protein [Acidobacteriota bacterium]